MVSKPDNVAPTTLGETVFFVRTFGCNLESLVKEGSGVAFNRRSAKISVRTVGGIVCDVFVGRGKELMYLRAR